MEIKKFMRRNSRPGFALFNRFEDIRQRFFHVRIFVKAIDQSFFDQRPEYVEHLLSEDAIRASDLFTPGGVARLTRKCQAGARLSEGDNMALVGILSTQLLHQMFVDEFPYHSPQDPQPLRICRGKEQNL